MLKYLSPTLLSLVIAGAGMAPGWSATADERDQHAIAVAKLMTSKMRLPADRQLKEFKESGYPANDAYLDKVLRFTYLDQFSADLPEADKAKNEAELKALRAELEPALKSAKLSAIAKQIFSGGGGSSTRMVNEIAKIMHPEGAPPLVPMAPEKVQALARLVDALGKQAEEDFNAAVTKVKANKAADDKIWDLPEGSKEQQEAINGGVEMRLEGLRPFAVAMLALRDAASRGKDFGLDPAPVQAQIKKMFTSERPELEKKTWTDVLAAWDFEWGEFNPFISLNCGTLLGDALVAGSKSVKDEDVEGILQKVADFSTKEYKDANLRSEAYRLKFQAWTSLLRYRLLQNNTRSFNRGWAAWQDFQNRAKIDENMRLGGLPKIAGDLGKLYIMAGRVAAAKGDSGSASALWAELSGAKPANPFGHYAKGWLIWKPEVPGGGADNPWSRPPLAMDPEKSLITARAFMSEANATADPYQSRQNYLKAAVALRNGVLGINAGLLDEKGFIEFAPQVYQVYGYVLYKMELRHQAVVAAQDGTRVLTAKLKWYAEQKKPNPWQKTNAEGKLVWDDSRITPLRVAKDAHTFASQLKARDPNTQSLYSQAIENLKTIDPNEVNDSLRKSQMVAMLGENDFEGGLRESDSFLKEFPDQYLWVFTYKNSAVSQWLEKLTKEGDKTKITALSEQLAKDNDAMGKRIDEELKKPGLVDTRKRELERARTTIKVSEIDNLLANKKYEDVIKRVDAEAIRNLPSEDQLAASMLRKLAKATFEWHEARKETLAKDPAALLAALKTYETVYQNLDRGIGKLRNKGVDGTLDAAGQMLAIVFTRSVAMIAKLQQAGNASAELLAMADVGNRAFADLYEPTIDDKTPAPNVLFIARTLWDVEEKPRAAKQFVRFIEINGKDPEVLAFRADPKPIVEKYSAIVNARGEFRKAWDEITDLSWDSPEDKQAYETLPRDRWPARQRVDYLKALGKLTEFRKLMATNKAVVAPEQFKQIETAVNSFNNIISARANQNMAKNRLATYYRESGQEEKSLPLLNELFAEDPLDPNNQMALVLVTYISALKGNPMPPKEELQKARGVAASIRDLKANSTDKVGYWEAYTLVMEFSIMLGEPKVVNDTLSFMRRNRSDMSRDMVSAPLWGDDKRARRPMNALSVNLAKRFLSLYEGKQGVTEKPAFKITEVTVGAEPMAVFSDPDAPAFATKTMTTPDDDEVVSIIAADGSTPPPVKAEPMKPAEPREDPADAKAPAKAGEAKPADAKPAEAKPADAKPAAEAKPADAKPADAKPATK